jgi:hypothetical protein
VGRVIQDVVTLPTRKWARIQGADGFIEWICGGHPSGDIVRFSVKDGSVKEGFLRRNGAHRRCSKEKSSARGFAIIARKR